jgi:glutamate/aspartate transport system permease protein
MKYNWNWGIFFEPSPEGSGTYLYTLWLGLGVTVSAALIAWTIALALGTVVGVLRTIPSRPAQIISRSYVEIFRNIPLLMQLFIWYFVIPELLPRAAGLWLKQLPYSSFITSVVGIGFYMSARVAEQLRSGIQAIPTGQRNAGLAMGLTLPQTYRYVLMPMALRIIMPPLTSDFLNTIKNTSVALTIGLVELTARAYAIQEQSFQFFEAFAAATLIFLALNLIATFAMRSIERAIAIPGFGMGR